MVFQNQDTGIRNVALDATGSGKVFYRYVLDENFVSLHDREVMLMSGKDWGFSICLCNI